MEETATLIPSPRRCLKKASGLEESHDVTVPAFIRDIWGTGCTGSWKHYPSVSGGDMPQSDPTSRRDFLATAAVLVTAIPGLGLAAKYVSNYLIPPQGRRSEEILLDRLSCLPVGASRLFKGVLGKQ